MSLRTSFATSFSSLAKAVGLVAAEQPTPLEEVNHAISGLRSRYPSIEFYTPIPHRSQYSEWIELDVRFSRSGRHQHPEAWKVEIPSISDAGVIAIDRIDKLAAAHGIESIQPRGWLPSFFRRPAAGS